MAKMVQIRNVPERLHRELKARAAREGMSLSDYLMKILERAVERATPAEMRERLGVREPVSPSVPPAVAVRDERDAR
jgi:plasmid stability protein